MTETESRIFSLLDQVQRNERIARREGWPGLPVVQIPLRSGPAMHEAIKRGLLTIHSKLHRTNPSLKMDYVAMTSKGRNCLTGKRSGT